MDDHRLNMQNIFIVRNGEVGTTIQKTVAIYKDLTAISAHEQDILHYYAGIKEKPGLNDAREVLLIDFPV